MVACHQERLRSIHKVTKVKRVYHHGIIKQSYPTSFLKLRLSHRFPPHLLPERKDPRPRQNLIAMPQRLHVWKLLHHKATVAEFRPRLKKPSSPTETAFHRSPTFESFSIVWSFCQAQVTWSSMKRYPLRDDFTTFLSRLLFFYKEIREY